MTDVSGTLEVILEFVELATERRRHVLNAQSKSRIEALDQTLRDLIDGARPAPRKIEGRSTGEFKTADLPPAAKARPAMNVAPAKIDVTPSKDGRGAKDTQDLKPPSTSISDLVDRMEMSPDDKKKLKNEVRIEDLPPSHYTPPTAPAFLGDYYTDDILFGVSVPARATPKSVVRAGEDGAVELSRDVRVLLGLEQETKKPQAERIVAPGARRPVAPGAAARMQAQGGGAAARATTPAPRAPAAAAPAGDAARGRPTIVHLMSGGVKRGQIEMFDPSSGVVEFIGDDGNTDTKVPIEEVLVIFFGVVRGEEPAPAGGQRVVIRLVNDKQVAGMTDDYREGGDSLTVAPEQRRGNVDRIWIPAWAVKEIQLG